MNELTKEQLQLINSILSLKYDDNDKNAVATYLLYEEMKANFRIFDKIKEAFYKHKDQELIAFRLNFKRIVEELKTDKDVLDRLSVFKKSAFIQSTSIFSDNLKLVENNSKTVDPQRIIFEKELVELTTTFKSELNLEFNNSDVILVSSLWPGQVKFSRSASKFKTLVFKDNYNRLLTTTEIASYLKVAKEVSTS